jgi:hypothetical protein
MSENPSVQKIWHAVLTGGRIGKALKYRRRMLSMFPANRRCKACNAPFDHFGAWLMPFVGHGQYKKNPSFCVF